MPPRSSETSETSTEITQEHIREWLTSSQEDSRAKPFQQRPLVKTSAKKTFGPKRLSVLRSYSLITFLEKTQRGQRYYTHHRHYLKWVTLPMELKYPRQTWVLTTFGEDTGYLHTPTTKANYSARSMQKWSGCREFVRVFGIPTPTNQEWLMGIPIGWTDSKPLAICKFQSWLQQHSGFFQGDTNNEGDRRVV